MIILTCPSCICDSIKVKDETNNIFECRACGEEFNMNDAYYKDTEYKEEEEE